MWSFLRAQIAADCTMNECKLILFASASSSNSLFSLSHTDTYYFCDLSTYILSPHMQRFLILRLSTCIISWKPQAPNLWLGVIIMGKSEIKALLSYWNKKASCLFLTLQPVCIHVTNQHSTPTKANMHVPPHKHMQHTHTGLLRQTAAWAGMSLVRRTSLWGEFIWDYIRDSYWVWTKIPTLANILSC